jgi:drug/metabolite transporter (DMT)-like permease
MKKIFRILAVTLIVIGVCVVSSDANSLNKPSKGKPHSGMILIFSGALFAFAEALGGRYRTS